MSALKRTVTKEHVNVETGEVLHLSTEENVRTNRRRGENINTRFALVFADELAEARLTGQELMTLILLADTMDIETHICNYRIRDIAAKMRASEPRISQVVRDLHEKGVIQKIARGQARVNPELVWRGGMTDRRDAIMEARHANG